MTIGRFQCLDLALPAAQLLHCHLALQAALVRFSSFTIREFGRNTTYSQFEVHTRAMSLPTTLCCAPHTHHRRII